MGGLDHKAEVGARCRCHRATARAVRGRRDLQRPGDGADVGHQVGRGHHRRVLSRLAQEVTSSHGDPTGGAFEWVGRGTLGDTIRIEMHGCTMVELDGDGQVTRWRDYFDLKEIETQMGATIEEYQQP